MGTLYEVEGSDGSLRLGDGTAGSPILTFLSDTNTGLYRIGSDNLGFAIGGSKAAEFSSSGSLRLQQRIYASASGGYYFNLGGGAEDQNGITFGSSTINFTLAAAGVMSVGNSSIVMQPFSSPSLTMNVSGATLAQFGGVGAFRAPDGTAGSPTYTFTSDSDNGLYLIAANTLGVATSGIEAVRIDGSQNVGVGGAPVTNGILTLNSTTKAFVPPRMTTIQRDAITSPSSGMFIFNTSSGLLNYYSGGVWTDVSAGGGSITYPLLAPDGSTSAPSYSFTSSTNSGLMYNSAGSSIQLVQNGGVVITTGTSGHRVAIQPPADPTASILLAADLSAFIVSSPLTLNLSSSAIKWGTANQLTLTAANPSATGRTINLPDPGVSTADVLLTESNQAINGVKTINSGASFDVAGTSMTTPGITVGGSTSTGIYRHGALNLGISSNGNTVATFESAGAKFWTGGFEQLRVTNGVIDLPNGQAYLQIEKTTNQIMLGGLSGGNTVILNSVAPAASRTYTIPDAGSNASFLMTDGAQTVIGSKYFSVQQTFINGNASTPPIAWNSETNSGFYQVTGGQWGATTQGTVSVFFTVNGLQANTGTVSNPGYAFAADTSTGMYRSASSAIGFATGGTVRLNLTSTALNYSVDCVPVSDATNDNGNSTHRWANVWGATIHSGDIELENGWRITEGDKVGHPEEGVMFLSPAGKKFKIAMSEVE